MSVSSKEKTTGLSIKSKLLLFALCISLIPITIITGLYYLNASETLKNQQLNEMQAIVKSKALHVQTILNALRTRTVDFSTDGFIQEKLDIILYGEKQNAVVNLNKHLSTDKKPLDPSIVAIAVLNKRGKVVASTNELLIGQDMSKEEEFTQSIGKEYGETFTGQLRYLPELDANVIFISSPVISKGGDKKIGAVINIFDSENRIDIKNMSGKGIRTSDFSADWFIRSNLEIIYRGDFINKKKAVTALNRHMLANKKPLDPYIMQMDVLDLNGKILASTSKNQIGKNENTKDAFARKIDKTYRNTYISPPHYEPSLKKK